MAKEFILLVLFANILALNCHEEDILNVVHGQQQSDSNGKPSYSFSYGVSDAQTGDVKAVWETKEGDTVKGHYSVLGPDGTLRSVEYSASPKTGFTAVVNNDNGLPEPKATQRSFADEPIILEEKALRDYGKFYDYPEEPEEEYYERRRFKRPFDPFREFPSKRRPPFGSDMEPSEYTHSITIKHPRDESSQDSEAHSHVGYSFDPNCKTKTKKESNDNRDLYANGVDYDLSKSKYPNFPPDSFRETFDKYNSEASNFAFEKIKPYGNYKGHKFEDPRPSTSTKYGNNYPAVPDIPDKYYSDDIPPRPRKKNRPHKAPEYPSDDLDDYILVPKKKYKPTRVVEPNDYRHEVDEDYDRPYQDRPYSNYGDEEDFRPIRGQHSAPKEVIKKIVKKKRPPVINLLDIFDI